MIWDRERYIAHSLFENTGREILLTCDLTQRQMDIVIAGGLLNYTKENG